MIDFMLNVFAEIADFFINFRVDKVIDKFAKKKQVKDYQFMERVTLQGTVNQCQLVKYQVRSCYRV